MFVFLGLLSGPHGLTCTQGCCLDKQCQQPVGCYFAPLSCSLFYYPGEIGIAVNNSVSCLVKHDALKREIYLKKNTTKQIQHPHPQILVVEVERKQFPPCLCSRHRGKRGRNLPGLLQAVLPQFFWRPLPFLYAQENPGAFPVPAGAASQSPGAARGRSACLFHAAAA